MKIDESLCISAHSQCSDREEYTAQLNGKTVTLIEVSVQNQGVLC